MTVPRPPVSNNFVNNDAGTISPSGRSKNNSREDDHSGEGMHSGDGDNNYSKHKKYVKDSIKEVDDENQDHEVGESQSRSQKRVERGLQNQVDIIFDKYDQNGDGVLDKLETRVFLNEIL